MFKQYTPLLFHAFLRMTCGTYIMLHLNIQLSLFHNGVYFQDLHSTIDLIRYMF